LQASTGNGWTEQERRGLHWKQLERICGIADIEGTESVDGRACAGLFSRGEKKCEREGIRRGRIRRGGGVGGAGKKFKVEHLIHSKFSY
jgi:hypothetical protein